MHTQEAATTDSLTAQWLSEIPAVWPHNRGTIAFSSSMGIGTKFSVKMDGQLVDTVVARGGAEAHLELVDLEEGSHTLSVVAEANGKSHEITSAFQVEAAIDTQIFGGPVHDYALFKLKSSDWDHFEYKLNDDNWVYHEDSKLVLGPLEIGRYELQVRAVNAHGVKDPVPARFIWDVNEAVEVQLDNPPVNTKAQTSQVAVNSSSMDLTFSIDGGPKQAGAPTTIGPLAPGDHTLRVWAGKATAPLVSSWVQEATPAFGRMDISVAVGETGWHELHAKATDPLGQSDPVGVTHRFFADFEPPEAHLELPSVQRENRTFAV